MHCFDVEIRVIDSLRSVALDCLNGMSVSISVFRQRAHGISADVCNASDFHAFAEPIRGNLDVCACIVPSSLQVQVSMVCTPDIGGYYLEIQPELIWVYPDLENYNQVFSNTEWFIN